MPQFKIHHVTRYTYAVPVRDSANQIILYPVKDDYQTVSKQDLTITGEPSVDVYKDYYGNEVGSFMFTHAHSELKIDSKIEVVTKSRPMPEDSLPKEEQWAALQAIKYQVPYIDFLKQESCESVGEIKRDTHVGQYMQVTPLTAAQ
jgi:hypothetical protein